MIEQAINVNLLSMISKGYAQSTWKHYERVLNRFLVFVNDREIAWEAIFTLDTLKAFQKDTGLIHVAAAIRGLSRYLFQQGAIERPIERQRQKLPEIYEHYLLYYAKIRQVNPLQILRARRLLFALNDYLKRSQINLSTIRIEHLDAFLANHCAQLTPKTRQNERSCLRGFLKYLYQERGMLHKDFAPLLIGAPLFAQAKPPKFLRPQEVQRLFASLTLSSPKELRTYAMLHLAYTLGLRPKEISLITLDDISFRQGEVGIRDRKSRNPMKLPLPEDTIKAIAAYIVGGRPKSSERALFLNLLAPYEPVSPVIVSMDIAACMRKANLSSSAYWLRHTYAQNLLEAGSSIFEIKEMLGHDRIQTTQRYVHIHTRLMREVLFDETF